MTVELITGHAGSAHISSADDGWLNVGTFGSDKYVLDTGTQFAAEVQSANLVTIGIGDAVFEGRHIRVSATENVAIDNGAQGVNRYDVICIKYEYDSGTDVESASLEVIKGTATSGTPSDPTIPSGSILESSSEAYMPLWRVPISGITVGTPVKLYGNVVVTLAGLLTKTWSASQIPNLAASKITSGTFDAARIPSLDASKITSGTFGADRIPNLAASKITSGTFSADRIPNLAASKITSGTFGVDRIPTLTATKIPNLDTGKLTSGTLGVARGGTGVTGTSSSTISTGVTLQTYGKVCVLTVNRSCAFSDSWTSISLGTIPSGSRPKTEVYGTAVVENSTGKCVQIKVTTAGAATIAAMGGSALGTNYAYGSVAWVCA